MRFHGVHVGAYACTAGAVLLILAGAVLGTWWLIVAGVEFGFGFAMGIVYGWMAANDKRPPRSRGGR